MRKFLSLTLLIVLGVLLAFNKKDLFPFSKKTKYVIVKSAFTLPSAILKPNAALLIDNEKKVSESEKLFLGNKRYLHACGYHYEIQFWSSHKNLIDIFPYNQECEEFYRNNKKIHAFMAKHIKILETNPTHYIYNLQIPISYQPSEVFHVLNKNGIQIFFMDDTLKRYPALTFSYFHKISISQANSSQKWDEQINNNKQLIIKRIKLIIDSIKMISPVIKQSDISFPFMGFGNGEINVQGQVDLKFYTDAYFSEVKAIIERNKGTIKREKIPKYYYIQAIDTSCNIDFIRLKFQK